MGGRPRGLRTARTATDLEPTAPKVRFNAVLACCGGGGSFSRWARVGGFNVSSLTLRNIGKQTFYLGRIGSNARALPGPNVAPTGLDITNPDPSLPPQLLPPVLIL